jgi:hypothetical protein
LNQFKIAFIVLLVGLFSSGCYTVVYLADDGDDYVEGIAYEPPPQHYRPVNPDPPYRPPYRPPVEPSVIQPIVIVPLPVAPPPEEYKTRPPENSGGNKERDPGVIDPIRKKGGRGNDGSRR